MYRIASHVMAKRSDSMNMITLNIPAAPIQNYLREKSREGRPISHMAVLMGGFVRLMAEFPALNRFIMNKEPYARNELAYGMVVMGAKAGQGKANEGTMSKIFFDRGDDIFEIERKIQEYVGKNREGDNATEDLMRKLTAIPGVLRFAVSFCGLSSEALFAAFVALCLKFLFGLAPYALVPNRLVLGRPAGFLERNAQFPR